MRDGLEKRFGTPESAKMIWQPKNTIAVDEEQAQSLLKMIEAFEDNDDVQEVFSNFEISDAIMQKLSAWRWYSALIRVCSIQAGE